MRLAHERAETCQQRGDLLGRRLRAFDERPLHDASRRGLDAHDHAIDRGRRRMRFQIQQDERAQRLRIAHRRGELQRARVEIARRQVQIGREHRRAAVGALEAHRQRLEHAAEHERQRFEPFDRPFEFERRLERFVVDQRHQRRQILAARGVLPAWSERAEPRRQLGGRQIRQLRQRADPPAAQHVERPLRVLTRGIGRPPAAGGHLHAAAHVAARQRSLMRIARMPPSRGHIRRRARRRGGRRRRFPTPPAWPPAPARARTRASASVAATLTPGRPSASSDAAVCVGASGQTHRAAIDERPADVIGDIARRRRTGAPRRADRTARVGPRPRRAARTTAPRAPGSRPVRSGNRTRQT